MKILKTTKGFTLIELMLVIAIITLLTSVVMFSSTEAKKKAQDAKMIAESHQVKNAISLYKETNGFVPNVTTMTRGKVYQEGNADNVYKNSMELLVPAYFSSIPKSPDGQSYAYGVSTDGQSAVFISNLKAKKSSGGSSEDYCVNIGDDLCSSIMNSSNEYTLTIIPNDAQTISVDGESIDVNKIYSKKYPPNWEIDLYAYYADGPANYWNTGCEQDDGPHCFVIMTSDKTLTPVIIR